MSSADLPTNSQAPGVRPPREGRRRTPRVTAAGGQWLVSLTNEDVDFQQQIRELADFGQKGYSMNIEISTFSKL